MALGGFGEGARKVMEIKTGSGGDFLVLGMEGSESLGHAAAAVEFALEGLYLMRRLSKDEIDGGAVYRT